MFRLKTLSPEAIDRSLEKAERYRLLNEPEEAESICLDVLAIDERNQLALTTLLLALTDQFPFNAAECVRRAEQILPRLEAAYDRLYYAGMIFERRANARMMGANTCSDDVVYEMYRQAMDYYDRAEEISPYGNEDALLRWNTCARQIMRHRLAPVGELEREREPALLE